jgi:streptogramin lyase
VSPPRSKDRGSRHRERRAGTYEASSGARAHCGSVALRTPSRLLACLLVVLVCLTVFAPAASARPLPKETVTLSPGPGPTYHLPPGTVARSLAIAPGGTIWSTGERFPERRHEETAVITRLTALGRLTTFALGRGHALPFSEHDLTVGPEGDLFFGELHASAGPLSIERSAIGRLSPDGGFAQFDLRGGGAEVGSIVTGPGADLWFTLRYPGASIRTGRWVGKITPDGVVTRYRARGAPGPIVAGPDGAAWFTDADGERSALGRISPEGVVTYVPLPGFAPSSLAVGWDGSFWVTGAPQPPASNELAHVTPSGQVTMLSVPGDEGTDAIARGPEGKMWFTVAGYPRSSAATKIDSIGPDGLLVAPACLDGCASEPVALGSWPDGSLIVASGKTLDHGGGGGSGLTSLEDQRSIGGTIGHYRPPSSAAAP